MNTKEILEKLQQPVYVVRPLPEKKQESKGRKFRRRLCAAIAAVPVVFMAGSGTMQYIEPSAALAKESFAGIGRIVEEHSDEPYKILDIVPADAVYYATASNVNGDTVSGSYSFTIGTMGYLVNGQAAVIDDLESNFKNNADFFSFDSRQKLTNTLFSSGSALGLTYREAYPGVDDISESTGWIQIFGQTEVGVGMGGDTSDDSGDRGYTPSLNFATGQFRGMWQEYKDGDKTGYDYRPISSVQSTVPPFSGETYVLHENSGAFRLSFVPMDGSEDTVGGYIAHEVDAMSSGAYSDTTCVYIYDESSGRYQYVGTIGGLIGRYYDINSDREPEQIEGETKEPEAAKPDTTPESSEQTDDGAESDAQTGGTEDSEQTDSSVESDAQTGGTEDSEQTDDGAESDAQTGGTDGSEQTDSSIGDNGSTENVDEGNAPLVKAITFPDGWRLLVEGEENAAYMEISYSEELSDEEIDWEQFSQYKIVVFEYVEEPWEGVSLYKVNDVEQINIADGVPYPYDSYDINYPVSTLEADVNLMTVSQNDTATNADANDIFEYTPGKGTHKLTRTDKSTDKLIEVQGTPVYFRCTTDNDWLKQYVFGTLSDGDNESDDFRIEVTTLRVDQVTADDVKEADLIFLEAGYKNAVLNIGAMDVRYIADTYDDMSEAVVIQILQSAVYNLTPVIVDYDIVDSEECYKDSNYQYLAKAFLKQDLETFYEKMDEKGNLLENLKLNVKDSDDFPVKDDNDFNYVNRNVYMINDSTPLVSEDFPEQFDQNTAKAGFSDVLTAIKAENTTLSEDDRISEWVSKARAMQYVINFSVGIIGEFGDLRVLEIQPSANLESDLHQEDGNTKLLWKTKSMTTAKQILFSKDEFSVTTDTKSVAEFNSEWEDINGIYDIVFIGLDGQRLNKNSEGETLYNNANLNGKVYHLGDESGQGTYDANDITAQKMDDLLEYMAAGYPVLVENKCFKGGSAQKADSADVNTDYIQEGSVMYYFLQAAVSRYQEHIFTISDTMSDSMFMTQVCVAKPRISLVDENGEAASGVQRLMQDENNEYHGQIRYRIENNRGEGYLGNTVVHVYADYNHDGYFVPSEEVIGYINEDNVLDVRIDGMGPGILPWKLEVSDAGNEYRRGSVIGYFELRSASRDEMKVLQITEKKNDTGMDLQLIYDKKTDSTLAYYLRGVESILNMDLEIETVTAEQLETRLSESDKYLEQWDVVVLTLDESVGSSVVADAVSQYVANGRSLLVCGQEPEDRNAGLSNTLLGQMYDNRTYVNLGGRGASGYLRYEGLNYDMFTGKTGLKAESVNEGSISIYPYSIGDSFTFGDEGELKASPYLLDFDDNLKTEEEDISFVTAWYTFGSDDITGSAYGISPKDARNNYYCYSKGNVVYLAQTKYTYTCDTQSGPSPDDKGLDECKFFVNALFAAYNAGLHNTHISIVSGFSSDAADIQSISVPFDEEWLEASDDTTGGVLDSTVDVYFKFRDNNLAAQKVTLAGFYTEAPAGSEGSETFIANGKTVSAIPFESDIWTVTDNKLVQLAADEELHPGKVYRIEAPVITLRDKANIDRPEQADKADIYIVLRTTFIRAGKSYEVISADSVSLNCAQLFLLE